MIAYMTMIEDPKHVSLFEHLYQTYRAALFRVAYAILRDHHWAEDALSETFFKMAKHIEKISALTCQERDRYLVILCRNSALDLYRRRENQETPIDFMEELGQTQGDFDLEETVFRDESYRRLVGHIESLEPKYRDVMQMHYLYGHSGVEIAGLLGIQEDTVYARLSRGRKKLAQALAMEEEGSKP